jgi:hypothetical protein
MVSCCEVKEPVWRPEQSSFQNQACLLLVKRLDNSGRGVHRGSDHRKGETDGVAIQTKKSMEG